MKHILTWKNLPTLGLLIALVWVIGARTEAEPAVNAPRPLSAATIDLQRVYADLLEAADANTRLDNMAEQLDGEITRRRAELEVMEEELDLHPEGSAQHTQAAERMLRMSYEFDEYVDLAMRRIDAQSARDLRQIYAKIRDTAERLATEMGYDTVFVDDTVVPLPLNATKDEMQRQISARRMIWTSDAIDLTDALVERMNAEYGG